MWSLAKSVLHLQVTVGAGSHTRQKSATSAMMTLATTKSSSLKNISPRLVASAVVFVQMPMPTCRGKRGAGFRQILWENCVTASA